MSQQIDPNEAMMMHCLIYMTSQMCKDGDLIVPYDATTKVQLADKSVVIEPGRDGASFIVHFVDAAPELRVSNCSCLGVPHRADCLLARMN